LEEKEFKRVSPGVMLFDTHSHLFLPEFDTDRSGVMEESRSSGVGWHILPNIDTDTIPALLQTCQQYSISCRVAMGIHPSSVKEHPEQALDQLQSYFAHPMVRAVGETGMDLYWDQSLKKEQAESFMAHIEIARTLELPLVIHVRDAFNEVFDVLEQSGYTRFKGVFHCFSGNLHQAKKAIEMGFHLGIGGVVTYKKNNLATIVEEIDLSQLLLETDSPYLPPVPFRGKRNQSSYLVHIAQKVAEIKNTTLDEIAKVTTRSAISLFKPESPRTLC
jgi:TatD DNase family protein